MLVIPLITQNKNSWEISTASLVMKGSAHPVKRAGEKTRTRSKKPSKDSWRDSLGRGSSSQHTVCVSRDEISNTVGLCRTFPTFWILSGVWFLHNNKITDRSKIIIFAAHLLLAPKCGLVPGGQYFPPVEKNNTIRRRRERRWQCQEPHKIADNLVFIGDQRPNNLIRTDFIRRSVGCSTQTPSPPHKIENTL